MKIFKSKIDSWLIALLVIEAVPLLAIGIIIAITTGTGKDWVALVIIIAAQSLPIWLLRTTNYTVSSNHLRIRFGPFKWKIALDSITSVQASSDLRSGPALSLDRLEIKYGDGKSVVVSPVDKAGFRQAIGHGECSSNASTSAADES